MNARIAYMAQPIDQVYDPQAWNHDVNKICDELIRIGYMVYRPARAWSTPARPTPDPRIERVNGTALRGADILVAFLPPKTPTIGVPMEIAMAVQHRVPVVVVTQVESFSLQQRGVIVVTDYTLVVDAVKAHEHNHPRFLDDGREFAADIAHTRINGWCQVCGGVGEPTFEHLDSWAPNVASVAGDPIQLVVREGAVSPSRSYADDAGLDLATANPYTIQPGQFVDVHTQVDAVQLPPGFWGLITGRSSTLRKLGLHVPVAVIDPGWRGPLFVGVWNLSKHPVTVNPGDRLGQLILVPNNPASVLLVPEVQDASRGLAGFGSSGA